MNTTSLAAAILALASLGVSAYVILTMDGVEASLDGKCYRVATLEGDSICIDSDAITYPGITNGICLAPNTAKKCTQ